MMPVLTYTTDLKTGKDMLPLIDLSKTETTYSITVEVKDTDAVPDNLLELLQDCQQEIQLVHAKDALVYDPTLIARIDAALQSYGAGATDL